MNKIQFLFNSGQKNMLGEVIFLNQSSCVPVDSFGCSILVIEDEKSISEMSTTKQLQDRITVITPCEEWPKPATVSSKWDLILVMKICPLCKQHFYISQVNKQHITNSTLPLDILLMQIYPNFFVLLHHPSVENICYHELLSSALKWQVSLQSERKNVTLPWIHSILRHSKRISSIFGSICIDGQCQILVASHE